MSFGGILAAAEAPSIPYALTRQTTFVYLDGQRWIDELPTDGYERAEFYSNPPRATREILHPEDLREPARRPSRPHRHRRERIAGRMECWGRGNDRRAHADDLAGKI